MKATVRKIEKQLLENGQVVVVVYLVKESEVVASTLKLAGTAPQKRYNGTAANIELAVYDMELQYFYENNLGKEVELRV